MIQATLKSGQLMPQAKIQTQGSRITIGRGDVADMIAQAKDGKDYLLELKEWTRSLEQNNTLWMWIADMKDDMGYTKQELYDALVDEYAPLYMTKNIQGNVVQKKMTTSKMGVSEMSEFLACVERLANEMNIKLRMP